MRAATATGSDVRAVPYAGPVPDGELVIRRMGPGPVPYEDAWELQRALHADRVADRIPDTVLLLEHEPVYTAGRRTQDWERPRDGTPVVDVDRGGRITWHGPGQLVGYPIVRLPMPLDLVAYVRRLEDVLIGACADLGLATRRVEGRTGVWTMPEAGRPDRKLAAIGVRVARGTTLHGFALNADCDLSAFTAIVPCGLDDAVTTSLSAELGRPITVDELAPIVERHLRARLRPVAATPTVRAS
jgi:lipoyl(octanoyl) transferase